MRARGVIIKTLIIIVLKKTENHEEDNEFK